MSLIRKHVAVLQAWACLDLVYFDDAVSARDKSVGLLVPIVVCRLTGSRSCV